MVHMVHGAAALALVGALAAAPPAALEGSLTECI